MQLNSADLTRKIDAVNSAGATAALRACVEWQEKGPHCPACGAAQRSSSDKRAPVRTFANDQLWHCFACQATGNAWKVYRLTSMEPKDVIWRMVTPKTVEYPPWAQTIWDSCLPLDPECTEYLAKRKITGADAHCRSLPDGLSAARPWLFGLGFRLVFPLYNRSGQVKNLRFRNINLGEKRKVLQFGPVERLILATPEYNALEYWAHPQDTTIFFMEGEIDFLTNVCRFGHTYTCGIFQGSWTHEHAARIPKHATVIIRTDDDECGEQFARDIAGSLPGRTVKRQRPKEKAA